MKLSLNKIPESLRNQLIVFSFLLIVSLIYTFFNPIPTDSVFERIGLGADMLDIGDRQFYINYGTNDYGYGNIKGGILYPFVLKLISRFVKIFNYGETSLLWNFLVIGITCIISLVNLFLIDISAKNIFGNNVARISNWIYLACPYTIFYALSGGLTMYLVLGTTFTTFLITNSSIFRKDGFGFSYLQTHFYLFLTIIYVSLLRPTGSVFGLIIIALLNALCLLKIKSGIIKVLKKDKYMGLIFLILSILFCLTQIYKYLPYLSFSLGSFSNERGYFYGIERELLRNRLSNNGFDFSNIKGNLYFIFWKISDFVGGISDIRDSHRDLTVKPLFPFLIRVLTGIFYIYPVNLFSIAGIFTYRKRILDSGFFIILIASIIVISPSILGVAMTRYLIMVYPPFIICCASILNLLFQEANNTRFNNLRKY